MSILNTFRTFIFVINENSECVCHMIIRKHVEVWVEQCFRDVLKITWDMDHKTEQNESAFHSVYENVVIVDS